MQLYLSQGGNNYITPIGGSLVNFTGVKTRMLINTRYYINNKFFIYIGGNFLKNNKKGNCELQVLESEKNTKNKINKNDEITMHY